MMKFCVKASFNLPYTKCIFIYSFVFQYSYLCYLFAYIYQVQVLWWIMFLSCLFVSPAFVADKSHDINYERVLEKICDLPTSNSILPSVCHSCHSARPLRAKHCKFQRRCVHKFDHYWYV